MLRGWAGRRVDASAGNAGNFSARFQRPGQTAPLQLHSEGLPRWVKVFSPPLQLLGHGGALVAAPRGPEVPARGVLRSGPSGSGAGSRAGGGLRTATRSDCPGTRPPDAPAFLSGSTSHLEQPRGAAAAARPPSSRWPENGLRGLCFSGREPRPVRGVHVPGGGPSRLRGG